MTALPTAAQMRALERAAMDDGTTGAALMERAGAGAVEAMHRAWPDLGAPGRALVLCGPGNNGGDGFVVARGLAERGWTVEARLMGRAAALPPDARTAHDRWAARHPVGALAADGAPWGGDAPPGLVVDALLGIGLARPFAFPVPLARALSAPQGMRPRLCALDVLSGLDADTGHRSARDGVRADLTLAFGHAKPGHWLADGPAVSGRLAVVDIGLPPAPADPALLRLVGRPAPRADGGPWIGSKARADRPGGGHKYDHGHVLVLSGGLGRSGAARLAARGALRIGAGLVTLAAPGGAMLECAVQLTAIMLRRCDDGAALAGLLADARLDALCLGPGLGTDARAAGLVEAALAAGRATVLDADALTCLAARADPFAGLHARCVLTPHGGEFARLFPDLGARLASDASKVAAAREAAARAGCTVVVKGADTVIAAPDGVARLHAAAYDRAAPWLATAGAGDVYAGMVAGLLARGLAPSDAAAEAAWCHAEAAIRFGPGLVAEDLPERIPDALRALAGD